MVNMPQSISLLVVGAGPVGLTAALLANQKGLSVFVIEKSMDLVKESRAIWIHPRTLEIWNTLKIASLAISEGRWVGGIDIIIQGSLRSHLPYNGSGLSQFPFGLMLEQNRTQALLAAEAKLRGISIEWGVEFVTLEENANGYLVQIKTPDGQTKTISATFVLGADGGSSTVRKSLGIRLNGGTYDSSFFVADVVGRSELNANFAHLSFNDVSTVAALPLPGKDRFRLIGNILNQAKESQEAGYGRALSLAEVRKFVQDNLLPMQIESIGWTSTYRSHHRVASAFRKGRVIIAGDAAHLHSPAGGLGMNTGIADAANVVWKISEVSQSAPDTLLESYSDERRRAAREVINTSDRLFNLQANTRKFFAFVRNHILPKMINLLSKTQTGKSVAFKMLSGTQVRYRLASVSSLNRLGSVRLGQTLPLLEIPSIQDSPGLQSGNHVLIMLDPESGSWKKQALKMAHQRGWEIVSLSKAESKYAGFMKRNCLIWVRPDRHVGWIGSNLHATEDELIALLGSRHVAL